MRGPDEQTSDMFSYLSPEQRVRPDHPLRAIRRMTDEVLRDAVAALHEDVLGHRPAVDSARAVAARVAAAGALHDSQRAAADGGDRLQRAVSLVHRARAWTSRSGRRRPSARTATGCCRRRRQRVLRRGGRSRRATAGLLSDEHFTVDGTLLEAWASLKSFQRKDAGPTPPPDDPGNPTVNFHGETRKNDTHAVDDRSRCAARIARARAKKRSWRISGHVLLDNRHGLGGECVCHGRDRDRPNGRRRCCCSPRRPHATTVGGDKDFDVGRLRRAACAQLGITPHVAQKVAGSRASTGARRGIRATRSANGNGN